LKWLQRFLNHEFINSLRNISLKQFQNWKLLKCAKFYLFHLQLHATVRSRCQDTRFDGSWIWQFKARKYLMC